MSLTPVYWFIRSQRSMNSQQKAAECMLDFATPVGESQSMQKIVAFLTRDASPVSGVARWRRQRKCVTLPLAPLR
jgi:hypothetical protein